MPHTPLIKRKATAIRRRKRNERWLISKIQSNVVFFLSDFDDDSSTAVWSRNQSDGIMFRTEHGVLQYISTYLNNRTDIILVHTTV